MIPDPIIDYTDYNPVLVTVMTMFGLGPFLVAVGYAVYLLSCADYF